MDLYAIAQAEIDRTLKQLPVEIRRQAEGIPVLLTDRPDPEEDPDLDADTLGLFVGEPYADRGSTDFPLPAQIILFLENIFTYAEECPHTYRTEVRTTYLHELGHYLGWDEDDLAKRELD